MKKGFVILPVLILVVLVVGGFVFFKFQGGKKTLVEDSVIQKEKEDVVEDKFITSNPLDLDQIESISAFRSCEGHDYSGKNSDGEKETMRSMKHYITPTANVKSAKAIAPFDGKIKSIEKEDVNRGVQVWLSTDTNPAYFFVFFHIDLLPEFKEGSSIKAGSVIGHSTVLENGENFDIALKKFDKFSQILETPFSHMSSSVIDEYLGVGVSVENIVLKKEFRDQNPCPVVHGSESKYDTIFKSANQGEREEDWVFLTH